MRNAGLADVAGGGGEFGGLFGFDVDGPEFPALRVEDAVGVEAVGHGAVGVDAGGVG